MLQGYIIIINTLNGGTFEFISYAYHMRLNVQQTPILLELRHVKWPYPDKVPDQCFRQFPRGKTMLHINT